MVFHVCQYCVPDAKETNRFSSTSSGDISLNFTNGHNWHMRDIVLHYVADHNWPPPPDFIDDVMNGEPIWGDPWRSARDNPINMIGYLEGSFQTGKVPDGFVDKLEVLMRKAAENGHRRQYRSL